MHAVGLNAVAPADRPLLALLDALAERIPIAAIEELWLFPPHRVGTTESAVILASAREADDDAREHGHGTDEGAAGMTARYRVVTARYRTGKDDRGRHTFEYEINEHGLAPASRIGKLVDGVLRRLDPELGAQLPSAFRISGDAARWCALRGRLAEASDR